MPDNIQQILLFLDDDEVCRAANRILCQIQPVTNLSLINALKHPDEHVRLHATIALGQIRDKAMIAPLIKLLGDESGTVRFHAVEALGYIGDAKAIEPLEQLILNQDFKGREAREIRHKARKAIKLIQATKKPI